jgi:hypothetical protein
VIVHADIYLLPDFHKWRSKAKLIDKVLCEAAKEIEAGLVDAELGGGVIKKRIAISGRGKRGGARLIVGVRKLDRVFFLYAYEKNQRSTISDKERKAFQLAAKELLSFSESKIKRLVQEESLIFLECKE